MKKSFLCLLMLGWLLLAACSTAPRLKDAETQLYSNEAGYSITLPADWQIWEEAAESTVFSAPEGLISLTIVNELGGEAYYGLDEITDMLLLRLQDPALAAPQWQPERLITDTDGARRQLFQGEDEAGATVRLDITVLQPHPGIRYYLLFAAGSSAYTRQSTLIGEIVKSFILDADLPYLYTLMEERRVEEKQPEEPEQL